jgi:predicted RNA binding protein YcfA (HicA-like mRNA interferase family)
MTARKIYLRLLNHTQNVRFADFCKVVEAFGYRRDRISGSHHIYEHPQASHPLNLQNCRGQAKPYQIRQFLRDVEEFQLTLND